MGEIEDDLTADEVDIEQATETEIIFALFNRENDLVALSRDREKLKHYFEPDDGTELPDEWAEGTLRVPHGLNYEEVPILYDPLGWWIRELGLL